MTNPTPSELALEKAALKVAAEKCRKMVGLTRATPDHKCMAEACAAHVERLDPAAIVASVPQPAEQPHKILIRHVDDECIEYSLDGQDVIEVNHDDHGWSGMESIEKAMLKVAEIIGATVEESHE